MKLLTALIAAGLFSAASVYAEQTPNTANDQTALTHVIERYETALNTGDVETIVSLYSKEPVFMPQNALAQIGVESVQGAYQHVFSNIKLNVDFTVYEIEVLGDTAWARTSSAGTTKILANEQEISEGNNELFVFKKIDSDWKIHRYLFATSQAK